MTTSPEDTMADMEQELQRRFGGGNPERLPSSAAAPERSARLDRLVVPDEERAPMPLTKGKYLVRENPDKVAWEREVRKFLRNLNLKHEHRVSAVMIYEWATNVNVAQLVASGGSASSDLRKINEILRYYFGKPYRTYICGRKVPNAYKVPSEWRVKRHKPMTLTLYAEWLNKTLNP